MFRLVVIKFNGFSNIMLLKMMLATSKHVFKIKACHDFLKNHDLLSAVLTFRFKYIIIQNIIGIQVLILKQALSQCNRKHSCGSLVK